MRIAAQFDQSDVALIKGVQHFLFIQKGGRPMYRPIIEVNNVCFAYEGKEVRAIDELSFSAYEGEWLSIVGHNGSGKSTLAKLLIGLQLVDSGEITIAGMMLNEANIWDIRRQVGMVFQNPDNQFVGTTVQDDVAFGLENAGIPREEMTQRVNQALTFVKMNDFLNQEPHHLSGGQKQRVAIASVLALQPKVIILDEATSMLDPMGKEEVLAIIDHIRRTEKITILSITHDLEEAAKADRMIVMNGGKLYAEGKPEMIFRKGAELVSIGLDLPFSVQLANQFKNAGILVNNDISVEGLVTELCKLTLRK